MNGKLYVSHTKDEIKELVDSLGNPCEIDIGILKVLHEDINNAMSQAWKDNIILNLNETQKRNS